MQSNYHLVWSNHQKLFYSAEVVKQHKLLPTYGPVLSYDYIWCYPLALELPVVVWNTHGLMEKQDLDTDTDTDMDTDICACTMVGLDYWTYPYYLF